MLFWYFSNITVYIRVVDKIPNQPFNVVLFFIPRVKVKKMENYVTNLSLTFNKNSLDWITTIY